MKRLVVLIFIFISLGLKAQDPEFTQFYANPLYLNPAFAGTAQGPRLIMNYRNQWPSLQSSFVTYAASWDQHFDKLAGGIGAQVMYDRAGDGELSTYQGSFIYSYHLNLSPKFSIKAGLQTSIQQKTIDFSKLIFGDMIHPRQGVVRETQENLPAPGFYKMNPFLDFSAGIMAFTKRFYAGAAVHHINKPKQSFLDDPSSILNRKYTSHIGMMIPLENSRFPTKFFSPNILFQMQDNFMQFNVGAYFIKDYFISGIWFRQTSANFDAVMALIGIKKDPVKIGYSYDITFSEARFGARGSHEISLIFELDSRDRVPSTKWRKMQCPDF
ncbi:MAG: type IX secretion system membrane protein PorP/SprF [Bacteroidota bacterium]|nr:type IX secretion system membrane protein PorP/SprF [Bacteroidota bacterium]